MLCVSTYEGHLESTLAQWAKYPQQLPTNGLHNMEVWFQLILFGTARGESLDSGETYMKSVSTIEMSDRLLVILNI